MVKMKKIISLALVTSIMATMFSTFAMNGLTVSAEETVPSGVVTLIEGNSEWKYEDTNTAMYGDPTTDFRSINFDNSAWKSGKAPLGYPVTEAGNSFGPISSGTLVNNQMKPNAFLTYYFMKDFTVSELSNITKLTAKVGFDDGFVMYINGTEVNRTYVDAGNINHATTANYVNESSTSEGTVNLDLTSQLSALKEGTNKIALSVHNRDANSSDIYFDMNLVATYGSEEPPAEDGTVVDSNKVPRQVNAHVGDDASTSVNITYTTLSETATKVELNKVGDSNKLTFDGTSSVGSLDKLFHSIGVTGLTPNTKYEYKVGNGLNTFSGTFKTAPAKGSKESFKFVYLADTQVSNATDAKALGATLEKVNQINDLDFVYLAGDVTNTAASESQWELLFNNSGAYPNGGQSMFANNLIAVIQGNHDNNTMNRHINAPAQEGNIVYTYDYGPAKFIMLNLETARYDATARDKQQELVRTAVAEAKAAGQWTIVGFHKSLYTGASHITDSDIIAARQYWSPILAEIDVDMVLQGHDHVYSRGFVTGEGENANPTINDAGKIEDPKNAPLWMVGGHAGGLKWYSRKNYTVSSGDPLTPNYSFLDINSTDTQSDVKKEQVIVEIEMSEKEFSVKTTNFKYDTTTDTITTPEYVYDSFTTTRNVAKADITGSNRGVADVNEEVTYTVSLSDVKDTNAFNTEVEYDINVMEFVKAESLLDDTILSDVKNEDGKASIIIGTQKPITNSGSTDVAKFTFKMKATAKAGNTSVTLNKADSAQAIIEDGKVMGAFDTIAGFNSDNVETEIYTYEKASDINGDGKITLADLSIALSNYQGTEEKYDIDLDSIINVKDFILISRHIAA